VSVLVRTKLTHLTLLLLCRAQVTGDGGEVGVIVGDNDPMVAMGRDVTFAGVVLLVTSGWYYC